MRNTILLIALMLFTLPLMAQKKEMNQAKTYIKSGKDFDKAEALLRKVVSMPGEENNLKAYYMLAETVKRQYDAMNEKLYLKTLTDTASVFPFARNLFATYETLDSVEARQNNNGMPKSRAKHCAMLNRYRANLLSGGFFSIEKMKYLEAFLCVDAYLDCERQPLFESQKYSETDDMRYDAACIAVAAAFALKDHQRILKYADVAKHSKKKAHFALAQLHQSYMAVGDTLNAIKCLREGFDRFPEVNYFFPRLADYYMQRNEMDTVAVIVNRALEIEPGNLFYRMAYNTVLLNTGKYDECIAQGDSLLHTNDHMTNAYFNVGSAYFNKALAIEMNYPTNKSKRKELLALYEKARPYIERYRQLRPRRIKQWGQMLYTIYLNLNMGKEFEDVDRMLKSAETDAQ